jgi:hypothetical protein
VASESWVRLDTGPAQVVVTYAQPSPTSPDGTARDLLLLAWDKFAKRWIDVFDAAKTQGSLPPAATGTPSDILPANAAVQNLTYSTITPTQGRTDLAFWAGVNYGANAPFFAYIVHYDGQAASVVYSNGYEGGSAKVSEAAPAQQLAVTSQWISPVDPECCPVRNYVQAIGWVPPFTSEGVTFPGNYGVVADNRSWLGVYTADGAEQNGVYPPPVVMTVVPGGPAAGVLQPGDQLLSVAGVTTHNDEGGTATLGPEMIDEVDTELPGTRIALSIDRGGQQLTENITLSSYANPAQQKASAPTPGYLGVEVQSDSPSIASEYGLGTGTGVVIEEVLSGTAAAQAGLQYDDVITSFGTRQVTDTQDLEAAVLVSPAFSTQQLTYVDSSGASHTVNVQMGVYPSGGSQIPPEVAEI